MVIKRTLRVGYDLVYERCQVNVQNGFIEASSRFDSWTSYVQWNSDVMLIELALISPKTVQPELKSVIAGVDDVCIVKLFHLLELLHEECDVIVQAEQGTQSIPINVVNPGFSAVINRADLLHEPVLLHH